MKRLRKRSYGLLLLGISFGILILWSQRPLFSAPSGASVLIFSHGDDLGQQLYALRTDGAHDPVRITNNIGVIAWWLPIPNPFGWMTVNSYPQVIANTNDILFDSSLPPAGLYRIGIDGRNQQPVHLPYRTWNPAPNLASLLFSAPDTSLHVVSADQSQDICISCIAPPGLIAHIAWSPDSQHLALTIDRNETFVLYRFDLNDHHLQQLTPNGMRVTEPAWSPDGTQIAFASGPQNKYYLFVINADGSGLRQVTPTPPAGTTNLDNNRDPTWSPDGQEIAFMSTRDGQADLYVTNLSGTQVRRLTTAGDCREPLWIRVR